MAKLVTLLAQHGTDTPATIQRSACAAYDLIAQDANFVGSEVHRASHR